MLKRQLEKYTQYNVWANKHIVDFILKAGEEKINLEQTSSFSSIRKTLNHIYDAELIWTGRLKNETLLKWPPSDNFIGTTEEFVKLFLETPQNFVDLISNYNEEDFQKPLTYKNVAGKEFTNTIADIVMHVMNHTTFHRGQLITMLRVAGYPDLVSTDFITFCRE